MPRVKHWRLKPSTCRAAVISGAAIRDIGAPHERDRTATALCRQRAVTRGVNKGAKEDLKLAMEKQMMRCEDDMEQLLVHFFKQERDLLQQQL